MDKVILMITYNCNNNCIFCLQGGSHNKEIPFKEVKKRLNEAKKNGINKVVLTGGEPTIHSDFIKIIRFSNTLGFNEIQCITNGRSFSIKSFLIKCLKSGLTEITLSIHDIRKEVYEKITNVDNSYKQLKKAINNISIFKDKFNLTVSLNIAIFKTNYDYLPKMISVLVEEMGFEGDVNLMGIEPRGNALKNKDSLFIDYQKSEKKVLDSLEILERNNIVTWVLRIPLMYLSGYEYLKQDREKLNELSQSNKNLFNSNHLIPSCYGWKCEYCELRQVCNTLKLSKTTSREEKLNSTYIKIDDSNINTSKLLEIINYYSDKGFISFELNINLFNKIIELKEKDKLSELFSKINISFLINNIDHLNSHLEEINPQIDNFKFSFSIKLYSIHEIKRLLVFKQNNSLNILPEIIITRKNMDEIKEMFYLLMEEDFGRIIIKKVSSYNTFKRKISLESGNKVIDSEKLIPTPKQLSKSLEFLSSNKFKNKIILKDIPKCFLKFFLPKNTSFLDSNLSEINYESFFKNFNLEKYIYNLEKRITERTKLCGSCDQKKICTGIEERYWKIISSDYNFNLDSYLREENYLK